MFYNKQTAAHLRIVQRALALEATPANIPIEIDCNELLVSNSSVGIRKNTGSVSFSYCSCGGLYHMLY